MLPRVLLPLLLLVPALIPGNASASHVGDVNCTDFGTQQAAQVHMDAHPGDPDRLDGNDQDGRACESLPSGGSTSTPPPYVPPAPPEPECRDGLDNDGDTAVDLSDRSCTSPEADDEAAAPPPPPKSAKTYRSVRVLSVIDGDTIKVRLATGARKTVRLIGIDTPETRKPATPVECGGKKATKHMQSLAMKRKRGRLLGKTATLTTDPTQDTTDRYGRMLAYVSISQKDIGLRMVRSGWAMNYVYEDTPFERVASYVSAETSAKSEGLGVWRMCGGDFHRSS